MPWPRLTVVAKASVAMVVEASVLVSTEVVAEVSVVEALKAAAEVAAEVAA